MNFSYLHTLTFEEGKGMVCLMSMVKIITYESK